MPTAGSVMPKLKRSARFLSFPGKVGRASSGLSDFGVYLSPKEPTFLKDL